MGKMSFLFGWLLLLFLSLSIPSHLFAVPAAPVTHILRQPDGTEFNAKQWGDENLHGWETEDGYTIVYDEQINGWTFATQDSEGNLVSSGRLVGKESAPPNVPKSLRPSRLALSKIIKKKVTKEINLNNLKLFESTFPTQIPDFIVPSSGTANVPVILINFKDRTTTYSKSQFKSLLFGTGTWSMKDYYEEVSYEKFSVSEGPDGIQGWFKANYNHDYYDETYGYVGDLVYEAVQQADTNINFANYDMDGDCFVDVVAIVHQGRGQEESGNTYDIWSHRWNLYSANSYGRSHYGIYTTNDICSAGGYVKVNDYIIMPERFGSDISTIGVFTHEYGHALGLPDLYDTDYTSAGIGRWSLMAGGSWNKVVNPGDRPAHLDPWCKYKLGWIIPIEVSTALVNEPIKQIETNPEAYKFLSGTPSSGEYFLVENRQKVRFDAGIPASGLLIWHIDTGQSNNNNECYPPYNCESYHYKVSLIQADNRWHLEKNYNWGDSGDPFPGSTGKKKFNPFTSPNSNLWNGSNSHVNVSGISSSGSTMYATLSYVYNLSIAKSGTGTGSVVSNPGGINCGTTCLSLFNAGQVTLTATGMFDHWEDACASCGTNSSCQITIDADKSCTAIFKKTEIITPNGGESLPSGGDYDIQWISPSIAQSFKLGYSIDNGLTWKTIGIVNSGSNYKWSVPIMGNNKKAIIKISAYTGLNASGNLLNSDKSDAPFTIEVIKLNTPNGGETLTSGSTYNITWTTNQTIRPVSKVILSYTLDGGVTWKAIPAITGNPGTYSWTVPTVSTSKTKCKVKVVLKDSAGNTIGSDVSDAFFTISPQ
jgi:immune inhibitor A